MLQYLIIYRNSNKDNSRWQLRLLKHSQAYILVNSSGNVTPFANYASVSYMAWSYDQYLRQHSKAVKLITNLTYELMEQSGRLNCI